MYACLNDCWLTPHTEYSAVRSVVTGFADRKSASGNSQNILLTDHYFTLSILQASLQSLTPSTDYRYVLGTCSRTTVTSKMKLIYTKLKDNILWSLSFTLM